MTVVDECAICMKNFDETTRNLMVKQLLVAADPLQNLNYTPSRTELKVNDVLAYIHGISCAQYQNILNNIVDYTNSVSVPQASSAPDLVVCLKCAAVLSKLYNTFKTFRQLSKARSINSRVCNYYLLCNKAEKANSKNPQSAPHNSDHRQNNSAVRTNSYKLEEFVASSNQNILNNNCSNEGIDEINGLKLEDEQPIFDLLPNDIGPYNQTDETDPLQDPLGDFPNYSTGTSHQEQHDTAEIKKDVSCTDEAAGILNSAGLLTHENNSEFSSDFNVEGKSESSQGSVHSPNLHVTDVTAPKITTVYQYRVCNSGKNVFVSDSLPFIQIQKKRYLILKPTEIKNTTLAENNGDQVEKNIPLTNSGTTVSSKDSTVNDDIAIVDVRTLAEDVQPTPKKKTKKGSRETQGKRKPPLSPELKCSVSVPKKKKTPSPSPAANLQPPLQSVLPSPSSSKKQIVKPTPPMVVYSKKIQCNICKKEFKTNFGLEAHINVAHTVKL